jgi:2-phosphoglycerate kinase
VSTAVSGAEHWLLSDREGSDLIYLIGGPPRGGKTTLARRLSETAAVPYFSLDHLVSLITPYVPEGEVGDRFPLRAALREAGRSNDAFYSKYSSSEAVDLYVRQAESCWPGIENFLRYSLADEHELILEGWQVLPRLLCESLAKTDRSRLRTVFLVRHDQKKIVEGIRSDASKHNWAINSTKDERTYRRIADMVILFGETIEKEAVSCHLDVANTDQDFAGTIDGLVEAWR